MILLAMACLSSSQVVRFSGWRVSCRRLERHPAAAEDGTMVVTEYKGYRIETSETAGKWRASISRSDSLDIRVGGGRYKFFRTGENPTEREAMERAHKLIDTHAIV